MRQTLAHTIDGIGKPIKPVYHLSGTRHENHTAECAIVKGSTSFVCTCGPGKDFEPDIYETCSYCGSIDPATLLLALKTTGTQYSGSDWKCSWPHKLYISIPCDPYRRIIGRKEGVDEFGTSSMRSHKFYTAHFKDATPEQIMEFNDIGGRLLGLKFSVTDGKLSYCAVMDGWQTFGVVGQSLAINQHDLNAVMSQNAPVVPQWFIEQPFEGSVDPPGFELVIQ